MTLPPDPTGTKKNRAFDDPAAIVALAQEAFHKAKREAIAENDRLGIASYGTVDGKSVVRHPPARAKTAISPT